MTARDDGNPVVGSTEIGTPVPDEGKPDEKPDANAELRAHNKSLRDENKELRGQAMETHLQAIGLNREDGLGKAIAKEYDGAVNAEALADYARDEYGHDSAVTANVPPEVQAGERLDEAMAVSTPVTPVEPAPVGQESIDKMDNNDSDATREDAVRSIRAKSGQFQETFYKT